MRVAAVMRRTPVVARVANAQAVSEGRPRDEVLAALTKEGPYGAPDVVLFSEVSPIELAVLGIVDDGWHIVQYGDTGSAEAGVAIASRRPLRRPRLIVGSEATPEGGGIRMRPFVSARSYGVRWNAGHAPPPRAPGARADYLVRARSLAGVVGADWNVEPAEMRRAFARQYRGHGVLGLLVPANISVSKARTVGIGSDHPAVDVELMVRRWR